MVQDKDEDATGWLDSERFIDILRKEKHLIQVIDSRHYYLVVTANSSSNRPVLQA